MNTWLGRGSWRCPSCPCPLRSSVLVSVVIMRLVTTTVLSFFDVLVFVFVTIFPTMDEVHRLVTSVVLPTIACPLFVVPRGDAQVDRAL